MPWTVTRQSQWPAGDKVVEISYGEFDYCNPGMFCKKYAGEGETFNDPRDAVEVAIDVALAWQHDSKQKILIALGATFGFTIPFEGKKVNKKTCKRLRKWARKVFVRLPKCDWCGELIGGKVYHPEFDDIEKYCSDYCLDKSLEDRAYQDYLSNMNDDWYDYLEEQE